MTPCRDIAEFYVYTETTYVALSQQYVFMFDVINYWYFTVVKYQSFSKLCYWQYLCIEFPLQLWTIQLSNLCFFLTS